jgi:hypothetical protein
MVKIRSQPNSSRPCSRWLTKKRHSSQQQWQQMCSNLLSQGLKVDRQCLQQCNLRQLRQASPGLKNLRQQLLRSHLAAPPCLKHCSVLEARSASQSESPKFRRPPLAASSTSLPIASNQIQKKGIFSPHQGYQCLLEI